MNMKFNVSFFLLSIFLLASNVLSISCSASALDGILSGDTLIGPAFFLAIIVIALAYAVGSITNNPHATVFAKEEIYPLIISALLTAGIGGLVFFSCTAFSGLLEYSFSPLAINITGSSGDTCYTGGENMQRISYCYLSRTKTTAERYVSSVMQKSLQSEMDSTNIIGAFNPISGSVSLPTTAWKRAYATQFESMAMSFALPALISLTIQILFLSLNIEIIRFILPAALLLRILPLTRQLGNVLIAIVIVLYVIVPFFYALNGAMDSKLSSVAACSGYEPAISDPSFDYDLPSYRSACESTTAYWPLARLIPHAFFLPNLVLVISITFVTSLSKALEGLQ